MTFSPEGNWILKHRNEVGRGRHGILVEGHGASIKVIREGKYHWKATVDIR